MPQGLPLLCLWVKLILIALCCSSSLFGATETANSSQGPRHWSTTKPFERGASECQTDRVQSELRI